MTQHPPPGAPPEPPGGPANGAGTRGEPALEASGLGIVNRDGWAVRDCSFRLPRGRIAALVGPNGDGKSSLLAVAAGLRRPAAGTLRVLGGAPGSSAVLPRVGLLLQDRPLHPRFTVAETLRLGRELNPGWDQAAALDVVRDADVPLTAPVGHLSGGQRTCVALALVLGKRPELLLLDEPMADLDPLRRHAMMAALMHTAAEHGTTVVMSSHILAELDLVCDYVLLLARGRMLIADDIAFVQAAHTLVTHTVPDGGAPGGPAPLGRDTGMDTARDIGRDTARDADPDRAAHHASRPDRDAAPGGPVLPPELLRHTVVEARTTGRQLTALIQLATPLDGGWLAQPPTLEEVLLAYLRNPQAPPLLAPADDSHSVS